MFCCNLNGLLNYCNYNEQFATYSSFFSINVLESCIVFGVCVNGYRWHIPHEGNMKKSCSSNLLCEINCTTNMTIYLHPVMAHTLFHGWLCLKLLYQLCWILKTDFIIIFFSVFLFWLDSSLMKVSPCSEAGKPCNPCLDAAKACNLNDTCKRLRSSYTTICLKATPPQPSLANQEPCSRKRCQKVCAYLL